MASPTCWRCGSLQPESYAPLRYQTCVYCAADLTRPPEQMHWVAYPPRGTPARSRPRRTAGAYRPPLPYGSRPNWSFPPSVWVSPRRTAAVPVPPSRDLRSVIVLAVATAALCVVAAGAETWRFVLLVRGRTEVLPESTVRFSDGLVTGASWAALILAVLTALQVIATTGRLADYAAARAGVRQLRRPRQRLARLLIPGWNLYGAGTVFAELDGMLQLAPPAGRAGPRRRFSWRSSELPTVGPAGSGAAGNATPAPEPPARYVRPAALVNWWWLAWVVNGVLAGAVVVRTLIPGNLQAQADLVELHLALDLAAAATAALTAALARRWRRLVNPPVQEWPQGWLPAPSRQRTGSAPPPSPTTEPVNAPSVTVS